MSRFNLTQRIVLAVFLAFLTGTGASGFLLWKLKATSTTYDQLLGVAEVQQQDRARVVQVTFKKQVQEWKNLLLRGHKHEDFQKYQDSFKKEEANVRAEAEALVKEMSDADAKTHLRGFLTAHETLGRSYDAAIKAFAATQGNDAAAADAMVKGMDRAPTDAIDALVTRLKDVVENARAAQRAHVAADIRNALIGVAVAFIAIIVAVTYLVRLTRREMVELAMSLTQAAQGTASVSNQVSTASQSLSQGMTEQAASLEETSASMEEMASMTRQNAEHSHTAAGLMGDMNKRVQDSTATLGSMVASMSEIRESSQQVAKIIKTIDEIAFQTNILALNAAVEAARAGETGMGFAVVADEVRNLAQRSAQAARDTAGLIEASIAKTQAGGQRVEEMAQAIAACTRSASQVKTLVDGVSAASRQQAQGIDQVSQAIAQMEKVTQTTTATAEENAAAGEELSAVADGAMAVVRQLQTLVGLTDSAKPAKAAARQAHRAPVFKMPERTKTSKNGATAEEAIPLDDTGTYGKF